MLLCGVPSLVGIGLGIAGLNKANKTGGSKGLAIAGIVISSVVVLLYLVVFVVFFAVGASSSGS